MLGRRKYSPMLYHFRVIWRWIIVPLKLHVCTVLEATTMGKRKIPRPPNKYKMAKDIQTPPKIYDYVADLSCCAKSEQNRPTQFWWGNRGSLSFFYSHTQAGSKTNSFISPTDHKYGRIWNIYRSIRVVSRPDVPFWGIVDDKLCLWVQIPQNPFLGTIQCKTYYSESTLMELRCRGRMHDADVS